MRVMFDGRLEEYVGNLRGRCQICGRELRLMYCGNVRTHKTGSSAQCAGSRELPWHLSDAKIEAELEYFVDQVAADDRRAARIQAGTDNEPPSRYFELHRAWHKERRDKLRRRLARSRTVEAWRKW